MSDEFCKSFEEAQNRYNEWKSKDPFPSIPPALLNSADIADYVRQTGMIYPFLPDKLYGATYKVRLKGLCVSFKEDAKNLRVKTSVVRVGEDDGDLPHAEDNQVTYRRRDKIILEPNAITYVTLEPVFQIPDYMALRFNLKISHVYKGLLLGTGPIIDPGFQGRLSIPLHNLTSNKYEFDAEDEMIELEFTKMSPNFYWVKGARDEDRCGIYRANDFKGKQHRQLPDYIEKALRNNENKTVLSSVVLATQDAKTTAEEAMNHVEKFQWFGIGAGLALMVAIAALLAALLVPTYQLIKSVDDTQTSYSERISVLEEKLEEKERELEDIRQRFEATNKMSADMENMEDTRDEN